MWLTEVFPTSRTHHEAIAEWRGLELEEKFGRGSGFALEKISLEFSATHENSEMEIFSEMAKIFRKKNSERTC